MKAKCSSTFLLGDFEGLQIWQRVEKSLFNRYPPSKKGCITVVLWPTLKHFPWHVGRISWLQHRCLHDVLRCSQVWTPRSRPQNNHVIWRLQRLNDFHFMMFHAILDVFRGSLVVPKWRSLFDDVYVHVIFTRSLRAWTCPWYQNWHSYMCWQIRPLTSQWGEFDTQRVSMWNFSDADHETHVEDDII